MKAEVGSMRLKATLEHRARRLMIEAPGMGVMKAEEWSMRPTMVWEHRRQKKAQEYLMTEA